MSAIKPWKKVKDTPYKAGYRNLIKRVFEMPNGKTAEYDLIDGGSPVCIFAVTKERNIVLAKEFRPAQEKILLELPGGGTEKGETPEQAAKRELLEETGYTGDFHFLGKSLQSAYDTLVRHNFIALNCEKIQGTTDSEFEVTEAVEMSVKEFKKHLHSGELTDVATGYMGLEYLESKQPTAYLICGFIGAGKTTFARKLEEETGAIRITKDEWIIRILGNKIAFDSDYATIDKKVTGLASDLAFNILKSGKDVIIDEGFWEKPYRDEMKKKIANLGAKPVLYFVDCPVEEMRKRTLGRNGRPSADSFEIDDKMFDSYLKHWQPPTEEEGFIKVELND